jgi:hypothetical protein
MAEVFVLGGGTPTPTEFRPGSPKTVNHQTPNPRNHVPKFQAKFGVPEEEPHRPLQRLVDGPLKHTPTVKSLGF